MRTTLTIAAFTIAAFLPTTGHAEAGAAGDAGDAGATSPSAAGAPAASGGTGGSGGIGGAAKGGSSGAPGPGISLPDPGTDDSNSCSFSTVHHHVGVFGTTLALGAAFLVLRRRRSH